jgi:hypothetical protein
MTDIMTRINRGEVEPPDATLQEQAIEVMLAYQGLADQIERKWEDVQKRKFPAEEYQRRVDKLKILLAAYVTLRRLADAESSSFLGEERSVRHGLAT